MRSPRNLRWLAAVVLGILFNSGFAPATAAPLLGTRSIGPTGDYVSITAAIADVQAQTLGGALVLEMQPNYVSTVETFPIVFTNLTTTASNTLTLRPQAGAANLLISSAVTTLATVDLNGAQFVTIDGRPGGVGSNAGSGGGSASQLTIANTSTANTSTSGRALVFINGASNNTICYSTLQGANPVSFVGVVFFGGTTGTNGGNGNNLIDHCDIRDGVSTPSIGIYAAGSPAPKDNRSNTVANCNILNFYSTAADQYGIRLDDGNSDWTITGNSFYQTVSRAGPATGHPVGAIVIAHPFTNNPPGNNFVVSSNSIGGSGPNATGTWSYTTVTANNFIGISLTVGSVTPSSVQGNTIQNLLWSTSQTLTTGSGIWSGIAVTAGSVNIGTVTGNSIGNASPGSTSILTSISGDLITGISSASSNTVVIANNTVSSIQANGTTTNVSVSLTGIQVTAGTNIISNNLVGSTTTGHSLDAPTPSTSIGQQVVTGILSSSTNITSITGNTVANLNNSYAGQFSGQVRGIITFSGTNTITGNTVRNLSTTSADQNDASSSSVLGICQTGTGAGQTVSQNVVHSLANTTPTAGVVVTGIWYAGSTNGVNVIARNLVHSLAISSTNVSSLLEGMFFGSGTFTAQNNMVRVGLRSTGASTAGASLLFGIYDHDGDAGRNFYHNSVYLGGSQNPGTHYTAALFNTSSDNARAYQNNIFVNARSRSSGTVKQYAFVSTAIDLTGFTSGGNIFLASGTGGVLGRYNVTDYTTLAAWQTATGQDASSVVADPLFTNPTGDFTTVDLHIAPNSPAINTGLSIGVTDDIDGDLRNAAKPAIGADEYIADYTLVPGYNQLSTQPFGNGTNVVAFQGVPTFNYALEMATNLAAPVLWQPLLTNSAAANGRLYFTNVMSQTPTFYRIRYVQ